MCLPVKMSWLCTCQPNHVARINERGCEVPEIYACQPIHIDRVNELRLLSSEGATCRCEGSRPL
ncbi:hypothetical protein B7P43_G15869 [Cryptotermes secundus]|uniref:Uncharacterized protein n=1 Tax=Cryptotermes secundus TaxID=105785 RepID=A0A2J7R6L6_9NEOP|nr:hypothetical protein B7P43_G15869 [Cryptotermes secundus]